MRKSKTAAKLWPQRWYFYSKIREIQEEEAQKCGELQTNFLFHISLGTSDSVGTPSLKVPLSLRYLCQN